MDGSKGFDAEKARYQISIQCTFFEEQRMFGTFSVGVNKAAESSHTFNTFLIPLTDVNG